MKRSKVFLGYRRGVSVAELLTVSFSMALLLSGLVLLGINTGTGWSFGTSKMTADNSASLALQEWTKSVRDGRTASVNSDGTQLTVSMPAVNAQGDYDRYNAGVSATYLLSGGVLYKVQGTTSTILGRKLTSALFSVVGSQVSMQVTARQQNGTKSGVTTLSTQVYLRNEPPQ